jgi:hypothetical protein
MNMRATPRSEMALAVERLLEDAKGLEALREVQRRGLLGRSLVGVLLESVLGEGLERLMTVDLPDGTAGHYMRNGWDCFRCAAATTLQVPYREIPDAKLSEHEHASGDDRATISRETWEQFEVFLRARGRRLRFHARPPLHAARWIGVVIWPSPEGFQDHSLVFCRRRLLFDPASKIPGIVKLGLADVSYGLTFPRRR